MGRSLVLQYPPGRVTRGQLALVRGAAGGPGQPRALQRRGAEAEVPLKGAEASPQIGEGLQREARQQSPRARVGRPAPR
eukprot:315841-Alexandrium_andersonii.AAC.1